MNVSGGAQMGRLLARLLLCLTLLTFETNADEDLGLPTPPPSSVPGADVLAEPADKTAEPADKTSPSELLASFSIPDDAGKSLMMGTPFFAAGGSGLVMLIFACMYKKKVVDKLPELPKQRKSTPDTISIWACLCDRATCLYTCCCLPSVAAKNYSVTGVCPFWPSFFLLVFGTYSCFYPIMVCIRACFSVKLRKRMGIESNFCMECCVSFFCFPLEVGRESIEVDEELEVEIGTCFRVRNIGEDSESDDDDMEKVLKDMPGSAREMGKASGEMGKAKEEMKSEYEKAPLPDVPQDRSCEKMRDCRGCDM